MSVMDMFKNISYLMMMVLLSGCTTVSIPNYIQDKNPYKRVYYADFEDVLKTTTKALENYGWVVTNKYDPTVFEQTKELSSPQAKQLMLTTDVRQTPLVVGTRYARINAYVRTVDEKSTEVEMRYVTVNSLPFKSFNSYRNDRAIKHLLDSIGEILK